MRKGAALFEAFTGEPVSVRRRIQYPQPKVAVGFGKVVAIAYKTRRDGEVEVYEHEFKPKCAPALGVSADGRQLIMAGGSYRVTETVINDI